MTMGPISVMRRLGPFDVRNVARDPLLVWIPFVPVLMALAFRFAIPPLATWLGDSFGYDLGALAPLLMSGYVMLAPTMAGMVAGFLLLDERDDRTEAALLVTPLDPTAYLAYRLAAPAVTGAVVTIAAYPIAGMAPLAPATLLGIVAVASLNAPATALLLVAIAPNKVAGLATVKALNAVNLVPTLAFFVDPPLQLAAGVFPTFWAGKALWEAADGATPWPWLAIGVVVNAGALAALSIRHRQRLQAA